MCLIFLIFALLLEIFVVWTKFNDVFVLEDPESNMLGTAALI